MKLRKILIVGLGILLLSQLPFAYRRYRLSRLRNAIQQLAASRVSSPAESAFVDYRGVIHVHTSLGGHSNGTFAELMDAAKANGLDFVIMTEHPQLDFDTAALTLNGVHGGVLFMNGNEVSTANGDRLLLIPGSENANAAATLSTQEVIDKQRGAGGMAFVAYPTESQQWRSASNLNGVEIYNLFSNARQCNAVITFFDGLWSYRGYPDLMFANFFQRPNEDLKCWDEAIGRGNATSVALAGNDAHSNIGFSLNDASGKQWLGIKLDPYERSFRVVRTHVLIKKDTPLTRESLLEAITLGHVYVAFDLFGDPRGFSFSAPATGQVFSSASVVVTPAIMGDSVPMAGERLQASAPFPARFVLIKDGNVVEQQSGTKVEFSPPAPGSYRVEVYLDQLPAPATGKPWIISNPIRILASREAPKIPKV